ncbi:hypothetical protein ABV540_003763 [Vibrio fluvialis]
MSNELDQALLEGNLDDIDALMEGLELDGTDIFGDSGDQGGDFGVQDDSKMAVANDDAVLPELIDNTKPAVPAESEQGDGNPENDGTQPIVRDGFKEIDGKFYLEVNPDNTEILGKDGKHAIPYAVLERSRQEGTRSRAEIEELRAELEQVRPKAQKVELLARQLEEAGITPDKLPDELLNDPEALEAIQNELGGTAGQLLTALVKRVQSQSQQSNAQAQEHDASPVDDALARDDLKELNNWQASDPDRWAVAIAIDNTLKNDPAFNTLPLADRFVEVQRRVKASFNDPVEASIQEQKQGKETPPAQGQDGEPQGKAPAAEQQTQIPNSPSRLGGTSTDTEAGAHAALASQDPFALEKALEGMSPDAIEAFLAEAASSL